MRLVTDYLENSAKNYPDKECFVDVDGNISFYEFQQNSKKIASTLISEHIFKSPVLVIIEKSIKCLTAFMGVAYSGNFYTPIDTRMPVARINKIIETLKPAVIITDKNHFEFTNLLDHDSRVYIFEELMKNSVDNDAVKQTSDRIIDMDALYVLFTSGSTGIPKGVVVCHRSVIDYTEWVTDIFDIDNKTIFGNQSPFYFDNSILDIYSTIKNGSTMHIIPPQKFMFAVELLQYLQQNHINTIFWVPSALCLVANLKALQKVELPELKKILFAGEVMPNKQLNIWRRHVQHALYANLYGPTEITDVCTYYIVDRQFNDDEQLPIGFACRNTDIIILTEEGKQAEVGEVGELCVRGTSLSLGYYNNHQKTSEMFVQNPINPHYPELIYKTGDLVKLNEHHEIIYLSRKDFQIKHMGHRIELGEIETAVSALEGIESVACIYDNERSKICMIFKGDIEKEIILEKLKNSVPEYMVPARFIKIDKMPLNANGKIDRIQLKGLV